MKPIIGIFPTHDINAKRYSVLIRYIDALEKSGGAPVIIPLTDNSDMLDTYISKCNGFLFPGGVDVNPAVYGASMHEQCGEVSPPRDAAELAFVRRAYECDKPFLGICRGLQLICAAFGGTLYQDIYTEYSKAINHRQASDYDKASHRLCVMPGSLLGKSTHKMFIEVNSMHHQCIKKPPLCAEVTALSPDGIIEAIEFMDKRFAVAVQWHPECMFDTDRVSRRLFKAFISACSLA